MDLAFPFSSLHFCFILMIHLFVELRFPQALSPKEASAMPSGSTCQGDGLAPGL